MIRVLIVGTGGMAEAHAAAFGEMEGVSVVAGVDTNPANLAQFKEKHGIAHGFCNVEDALAWGNFDAVSNVTPDAVHCRSTLPFLAAGKHVLCEKPLATNHADAASMARAAEDSGVINMVNLTYRNVPALMEAARIVRRGEIGEVRHFEAAYLQSWLTQPAWGDWKTEEQWLWRLSSEHGSLGVLGDVGVHILDLATFAAGSDAKSVSCRLQTFPKAPGNRIGPYPLDANDSMVMHLQLGNEAIGTIHASRFASGHLNDLSLRLYGTKGGLEVKSSMTGGTSLRGCFAPDLEKCRWQELPMPEVQTNFVRFIKAIEEMTQATPDFARGAALQKVLDLAVASHEQRCRDQRV